MATGLKIGSSKIYKNSTTVTLSPSEDSYSQNFVTKKVYNRSTSEFGGTKLYQYSSWKTSAQTGNVSAGNGTTLYYVSGRPSNAAPVLSSYGTIDTFTYATVTVSAGANGYVSYSGSGSGTINSGSSKTFDIDTGGKLSVEAKSNVSGYYRFLKWSDGVTTAKRDISVGTSSISVSAEFVENPSVTVFAETGGSVSQRYNGYRCNPGETFNVTAKVEDDTYRFVGWFLNGALHESALSTSFTVGQTDVTMVARFASKYHNVAATAGDGGNVELYVDGESVGSGKNVSASNVLEGTTCRIVCRPDENYLFDSLSIDNVLYTNASSAFVVSELNSTDIVCSAIFKEREKFSVRIEKDNPSLGTVSIDGPSGSWAETGDVVEATLHTGVTYTARANVNSALSPSGRELNEFVGWYENNVLLSDSREYGIYQESKTGRNIVAKFAPKQLFRLETYIPVSVGGSAEIVPGADSVEGSDIKWLKGSVSVVVSPSAGYYVGSFNVTDLDSGPNGFVSAGEKMDDGRYRLVFTLSFNARVTINFSKIPCTVTCDVDEKSSGAGIVSSDAGSVPVYGEVVTFSATPTAGGMYGFSRWCTPEGDDLPDSVVDGITYSAGSQTYRTVLVGDVSAVARFSARISAAASDPFNGGVSIDGSEHSGATSKFVELGTECTLSAHENDGRFFAGWYSAVDTDFVNPLDIGKSEAIMVYGPMSYVARLISSADYRYVALCNIDNDTESGDETLGALTMSLGTSWTTPAESVQRSDFMSATGLQESEISGAVAFYRILGASRVSLNASPLVGRGFYKWTRVNVGESVETEMSQAYAFTTVVGRSAVFRAYWGDPKPVRVTTNFAEGSTVANGALNVEGVREANPDVHQRIDTGSEVSDLYTQGDIVAVSVDIKNGYLFAGWFYDSACTFPVVDSTVDGVTYTHESAKYVFEVGAPVTLCAKFVRDMDAIYKWEGGDAYKTAQWRSKMYALSRPDDFTTARIDAEKYPLDLVVTAYSSPDVDAKATGTKSLRIMNQDMRRLPHGRKERYMQILVRNNGPVDAVIVGTSSMGVSV